MYRITDEGSQKEIMPKGYTGAAVCYLGTMWRTLWLSSETMGRYHWNKGINSFGIKKDFQEPASAHAGSYFM